VRQAQFTISDLKSAILLDPWRQSTLFTKEFRRLLTKRTFNLPAAEEEQGRVILDAEFKHIELLQAQGGRPLKFEFFHPAGVYDNGGIFAEVKANVESVCTAIYLAAARRLADLGNSRLAATMGQLACNEAQHTAVARDLGGLVPSDNAWAPPFFFNVSDAQPVLAPFLNDGEGFVGPVAYPGWERVAAVLGESRARIFPTFLNAFRIFPERASVYPTSAL
jgi:hypothetical protein